MSDNCQPVSPPFQSARRLVLKLGSSTVTDGRGQLRFELLDALCHEVAEVMQGPPRRQVILVTSGAIAMGWPRLGLRRRPPAMPEKQAAAAVGQGLLMSYYEQAMMRHAHPVGQILLTAEDVRDRRRFMLARRTVETLLNRGAVPVVNENDTVAVDEIRLGDNDTLSALVAVMVEADLLIILSDVDGLYTSDPRHDAGARHIAVVDSANVARSPGEFRRAGGPLGTGGMGTKVEAAALAGQSGIPVVVAKAVPGVVKRILAGDDVGTRFRTSGSGVRGKKRWMLFRPVARGAVRVDDGAARAILEDGKSLLPSGVTSVEGEFEAGGVVRVLTAQGDEIARGVSSFSSSELRRALGLRSDALDGVLGYHKGRVEVVHRDDLVITAPAGMARGG